MVEKSDEFDECMLNSQSFPYQTFELRKSRYGIFYGYNLLTCRICHDMSEHGTLKYFRPITHKKDAPEDLSNLSGPYLSKVIATSHRQRDQLLGV